MAQMEYLALLLPKLDLETIRAIAGTGDTAAALDRIALFCEEPKSAELRRVSIHVVLDLCEMDAEALCIRRICDLTAQGDCWFDAGM